MGHRGITRGNTGQYPGFQVRDGGATSPFEQRADHETEPHRHLGHPGGMVRRRVQPKTLRRSSAQRGTRGQRLEKTARLLVPQIVLNAIVFRDKAPHACRLRHVQGVSDPLPPRPLRISGPRAGKRRSTVLCSPCRSQRRPHARALRASDSGEQGPRPAADIFARAAFHAPRSPRESGMCALQGVETRHLVGGPHPFPCGTQGRCRQGEGRSLGHGLIGSLVRLAREPGATPMRCASDLIGKTALRGAPQSPRQSPVGSPRRPTRAASSGGWVALRPRAAHRLRP